MRDNSTSSQTMHAGEIQTRQTSRGIEFHAFNHQRGKALHIGTVIGQTYEKVARILQLPAAGFALTQAEYAAVLEAGAQFIRILPPGGGTYGISVEDFGRYAKLYHNGYYGSQLRVDLDRFQFTSKTARRNARTDNPATAQPGPIAPREKQLTLNGWMK